MTLPNAAPTRKLIDVEKILDVLDAEKHLVHGTLVQYVYAEYGAEPTMNPHDYLKLSRSENLPEPGPLAVANCQHVGRCALGSLLYATGKVSHRDLDTMDGDAAAWGLQEVKALYDSYGLERQHAIEIISANDGIEGDDEASIAGRRERVKRRVRNLADEQNEDPESDLYSCQRLEAAICASLEQERMHFSALDLGDPITDYDDEE